MTAILERHTSLGIEEVATPPEPSVIGPTWQLVPDWTPGDPRYKYLLPEHTLGWQIQAWVEGVEYKQVAANINSLDDTDEFGEPLPFRFTQEQLRFVLWMYAVDERGRFIFRDIVLQRLKGWGKDPLAAVITAVEFVGPSRFAGWAAKDYEEFGIKKGDPVGKRHQRSWIQIAAVSKEQTKNTMTLFPGLFSKECIEEHRIDLGKQVIYAHGGKCRIEAVTSNPRSLEGGRPTLVIKNETHHWLSNNNGHEMSEVIDRNITKAKGGQARTLSITNAYNPGEDSVAQQERESWEEEVASGWAVSTMYDSLEAHADALLRPPDILTGFEEGTGRPLYREPTEQEIAAYIGAVVSAVTGDADWLDVENTVKRIMKPKSNPTQSRRFYYNQVLAAEDAWVHSDAVRAAVDKHVVAMRRETHNDPLRVGWAPVAVDDEIVMFFDGSKSRDATGLVGCRISDGYLFVIGVWQQPRGERGKGWLAPRAEVDLRVKEAHRRFNVVGFWADPSHALDDDDDTRYWDGYIDDWHQEFQGRYKVWATKTGETTHSIMWDMTSPAHQDRFVKAAERFVGELERRNDIEEFDPLFRFDGHPALINHLNNARAYAHPKGYGTSLHKGSRMSKSKIDLAVCAVGARMLRRVVMNQKIEDDKSGDVGELW